MPGIIENELGKIAINEDAIATLVGYVASENYGIVGMNGKTAKDMLFRLVGTTNHSRGVKVTPVLNNGQVDIDIHVTVAYGISIHAVAQNTISNVRYYVNDMLGLGVRNVNIHVEGILV